MLLKAGSVLTFQIHYTTNGTAASDRSMHRLQIREGTSHGGSAHRRDGESALHDSGGRRQSSGRVRAVEFIEDVTIYSMIPHTHLRGKSWEHTMTYPDGRPR